MPATYIQDVRSTADTAPTVVTTSVDLDFDFDLDFLHNGDGSTPSQFSGLYELIADLSDELLLGLPTSQDPIPDLESQYSPFNEEDRRLFNKTIRGLPGLWSPDDDDNDPDEPDQSHDDDAGNDSPEQPPGEDRQPDDFFPSILRPALARARAAGTFHYNYAKGEVVWTSFFETFQVPVRFHRAFRQGVQP